MKIREIEEGKTYMFVATYDTNRKHLEGKPFTVTEKREVYRYNPGRPQRSRMRLYNENLDWAKSWELEPMPEERQLPERILIEAAAMEFHQGGNTIWIQSPQGATVLRIKCTGKILTEACKNSETSHGDIIVDGDIHVCVGNDLIE